MWLLSLLPLLALLGVGRAGVSVCLHAQVSPQEKVVGSAVTTEGMRAALLARADVSSASIFYPFHYGGLPESSCELVLIEGWFPSIHTFISLVRSSSPAAVVLFYCLDPSYPGMQRVLALDVDGFLTNSRKLVDELKRRRPTIYVPLAADIELMRPLPHVIREYGAVYVGAGSNMLKVKPLLAEMLYRSVPFGLRLHGAHWSEDIRLKESYRGVLPQGTLHEAYSSAHAVLACTVNSQRDMGMINNRIFEALSCGNVVISDYSDILNETFGSVLQFVHKPEDVNDILEQIMNKSNADYYNKIRLLSRKLIVNGHTWSHRVLEILDFYKSLTSPGLLTSLNLRLERRGEILTKRPFEFNDTNEEDSAIPLMAWIVSERLRNNLDNLLFVRASMNLFFADKYLIHEVTQFDWLQLILNITSDQSTPADRSYSLFKLNRYSLIFAVMNHFDLLHLRFITFHQWHRDEFNNEAISVHNNSDSNVLDRTQQKYIAYIIGVDDEFSHNVLQAFSTSGVDNRGMYLSEVFDMVLFRDSFERKLVADIEKASLASFTEIYCKSNEWIGNQSSTRNAAHSPFENRTCQYASTMELLNDFKWQICYGIWEENNASRVDWNVDSSQYDNIAICIWAHKAMCLSNRRTKFIPPNVNYSLLLIGSTLSEWISYCELKSEDQDSSMCVLDNFPLSQVTHVREGHVSGIFEMLSQAKELHFIFNEYNINNVVDGEGNFLELSPLCTIQDVIWPLIFGATYQKAIRLAEEPSEHIAHLIRSAAWNRMPVRGQWERVLNIVLSFGSFKTEGEMVANYVNHPCHRYTMSRLDTLSCIAASGESEVLPQREIHIDKLMSFISFKNFVPGLDGQACFFLNGVFSYCRHSRELYLLELDLHHMPWSAEDLLFAENNPASPHIPVTTNVRVELRGVLYLQYFYLIEEKYVFCLPNPYYNMDDGSHLSKGQCLNGTENTDFNNSLEQKYIPR